MMCVAGISSFLHYRPRSELLGVEMQHIEKVFTVLHHLHISSYSLWITLFFLSKMPLKIRRK